jgi:hypothetical protein
MEAECRLQRTLGQPKTEESRRNARHSARFRQHGDAPASSGGTRRTVRRRSTTQALPVNSLNRDTRRRATTPSPAPRLASREKPYSRALKSGPQHGIAAAGSSHCIRPAGDVRRRDVEPLSPSATDDSPERSDSGGPRVFTQESKRPSTSGLNEARAGSNAEAHSDLGRSS